MKKAISVYGVSLAKQIAFTAVFAALCCVSTLLVSIPLPASGYFNTGDVFVLLSGWCLGPLYGSVAAAVGSALADIFSGYALYAPATFLIKGMDAFVAYMGWVFFKKFIGKPTLDFLPRLLSVLFGEAVMVGGYFLFESLILGLGLGAVPNVFGNALQAVCCGVLAVLLIAALYPVKSVQRLFPALGDERQ